MLVTEFNQTIKQYEAQINKLKQEKDDFIRINKEKVLKTIEKRREQERDWFIKNFDSIWENKKLYSLGTEKASIIVDCFKIYLYARCGAGRGWSVEKISLGKLIKLWESGYLYKGYPIIEYHDTPLTNKVTYIKDNQLHIVDLKKKGIKQEFSQLCMQILRAHNNRIDDFSVYRTIGALKEM